jgi:uncharacterized repeat protein (TIGR03943 family)
MPSEQRELKRIQYLASSLVCLGIFIVGVRGNLDYFIHPRYILFTNLMSLFGFITLFFAGIFYKHKKDPTELEFRGYLSLAGLFISWALSKGVWLLLIVFFALAVLPPKPLLSGTANNKRSQNYWQDYKNLRFIGWADSPQQINEAVGLLLDPTTSDSVIGKEVKLSGFLLENENGGLMLARFVLSCCAVDANPSRIWIGGNLEDKFEQNSWLEIEGILDLQKTGADLEPVILTESVRPIEKPAQLYEYLRFE